jgi:hypothetical protein
VILLDQLAKYSHRDPPITMDRRPDIELWQKEKGEATRHTLKKNSQLVVYNHFLKYKQLLNYNKNIN